MTSLRTITCCLGLAIALITAAEVHAAQLPPVGDYPDAECTYDSSGDIYVSPTGHFWECICEKRTFIEDDCGWYNQGPINSARNAKLRKLIKKRLHVRVIPRSTLVIA